MANGWTLPPKPFSDKKKLIVGVSGGSDSLGLLLLLLDEIFVEPKNLIVAHVNYGLREVDSDLDEDLIRRICRERNLLFKVLRVTRFRLKVQKNKRSPQD